MMKKLVILLIVIPFLGFSQNKQNEEYYNNGQLKYKRIIGAKGEIIQEYYKNGQLKYQKNDAKNTTEKYYKNGQLNYRKTSINNIYKEEFYDRDGALTIQTINDTITFSLYEHNAHEHKNHNHFHDHGHEHNHTHKQNHTH